VCNIRCFYVEDKYETMPVIVDTENPNSANKNRHNRHNAILIGLERAVANCTVVLFSIAGALFNKFNFGGERGITSFEICLRQ